MVQWLRLCAPDTGGLGSTPGQGTGTVSEFRRVGIYILILLVSAERWRKWKCPAKSYSGGTSLVVQCG